METKSAKQPTEDEQEAAASEVPPKTDPNKVAGSLNPKAKNAFYDAVIKKPRKRR